MFKRAWPPVVIGLLTLLFFHRLAFTDLILGRGDTFNYFYPYWDARNAALAQGKLPLWTPDLFMGVPLLANPQLGTLYPPNWLTIPLAAPDAVRASTLLHVAWAMLGAYALGRGALSLERLPALAAALIYGLSGYTGAHVEQINQLQGLAWMPWLFWLYHRALDVPLPNSLWLSMALALQIFTGHTQTVFISGVGLGVYGLLHVTSRTKLRQMAQGWPRALVILAASAGIAALLTLPQLIPSAELTGLSNRGGGLLPNQATAFSFNPLIMGRALLPSYDSLLFGEYIAYVGVIGLGLGLVGVVATNDAPVQRGLSPRVIWLAVALVGLTFALGYYNPLYWLLASLPGFNLFRVPARWLALFALGAAMLAGLGLQWRIQHPAAVSRRMWAAALLVPGLLMASSLLSIYVPVEDINGPALPTLVTLGGWGLAAAVFLIFLWRRQTARIIVIALAVELFLASLILPFNDPVPPDVYSGQRFPVSQMRVYSEATRPPPRLLSISQLLFDPGDKAALEARYQRGGLDAFAIRYALVSTKRQEMLFPNLPLTWDVPSVDGFDGGLLPTLYYTQFTALLLPEDTPRTVDGRLGEMLAQPECRGACLPGSRWLDLTNTGYVITDKVYDLVREGIFYDTQFMTAGRATWQGPVAFTAAAIDVLSGSAARPDLLEIQDTEGNAVETRVANILDLGPLDTLYLTRFILPEPARARAVVVDGAAIYALSLVDTRTGDFLQLAPQGWSRIFSGDVKIYERTPLPRAFIVYDADTQPDTWEGTEAALNLMRQPSFQPGHTAILHSAAPLVDKPEPDQAGAVSFEAYTDERIVIHAESAAEGYLVIADAYYPGWEATVNGEDAPIYRANVMFRAVPLPAGESEIILTYSPDWLGWVFIAGGLGWLGVLGAALILLRRRPRDPRP